MARDYLDHGHDLPEDGRCPRCQEILDACTGVGHDATPKPGDLSVCSPCGAVLEFTGDLSFRLMTDAEIAALDDETLLALLDGIEGACGLDRVRAELAK